MISYAYEMAGCGANDQTWTVMGTVKVEARGMFANVPEMAMKEAFMKLTNGEAVYGKPGVGCHGPYRINRLLLQEVQ